MTVHYLDSSALLKRVLDEAESAVLRSWIDAELRDGAALVTSDLGDVEVARAARRYNFSEHEEQSATTEYLKAVACSRLGRKVEGREHFLTACGMDERMQYRGNLDPEITELLKQ